MEGKHCDQLSRWRGNAGWSPVPRNELLLHVAKKKDIYRPSVLAKGTTLQTLGLQLEKAHIQVYNEDGFETN